MKQKFGKKRLIIEETVCDIWEKLGLVFWWIKLCLSRCYTGVTWLANFLLLWLRIGFSWKFCLSCSCFESFTGCIWYCCSIWYTSFRRPRFYYFCHFWVKKIFFVRKAWISFSLFNSSQDFDMRGDLFLQFMQLGGTLQSILSWSASLHRPEVVLPWHVLECPKHWQLKYCSGLGMYGLTEHDRCTTMTLFNPD